jgi:hypothetical protein
MRNFLLGLFVGLILATSLSVFAQLAPFDAPLKEQLNGQQAEQWLGLQRELEQRDRELHDYATRRPCP